jgi:hypothetical protein
VDNDRDGRGLAVADFDDDGRLDFLQTNADQPSLLYRNATADAGSWVELSLVGTRSNRDAIGARAEIRLADALLVREVNGGNGYASQSMRRLHFGLGEWSGPVTVDIRWPSGLREKVQVPIGRVSTITEGKGLAIAPPGAARR